MPLNYTLKNSLNGTFYIIYIFPHQTPHTHKNKIPFAGAEEVGALSVFPWLCLPFCF